MGLMAVFALILIILLWLQHGENKALAKEKFDLQVERSKFALELTEAVLATQEVAQEQDGAEQLVSRLFEQEGCQLRIDGTGQLRLLNSSGDDAAADLYDRGQTRLGARGLTALESCKQNFIQLAYCLAPAGDTADEATRERLALRGQYCSAASGWSPPAGEIARLRSGIEALVLEGSTDRLPYTRDVPAIQDAAGRPVSLAPLATDFVQNSQLGAERARQALGHLLRLLADRDQDEGDALQVMMAKARVESPSFGSYQVGPRSWRAHREERCDSSAECPSARKLALRLRWKKEELRRPHDMLRNKICQVLAQPGSSILAGLAEARLAPLNSNLDPATRARLDRVPADLNALRKSLRCDEQGSTR